MGKHHPLVCQTVEVRRDARVALGVDGIDKGAAAALHQYNQHIGPCGVEQRLGRNLAIIIEVAARNLSLKRMGYSAAHELDRRLNEMIMKNSGQQ